MSTLLQAQAALLEERRIYEFDPKALEALIVKDLAVSPSDTIVEFLIVNEYRGYGQGEHQAPVFKGVRVTCSRTCSAPHTNTVHGDR